MEDNKIRCQKKEPTNYEVVSQYRTAVGITSVIAKDILKKYDEYHRLYEQCLEVYRNYPTNRESLDKAEENIIRLEQEEPLRSIIETARTWQRNLYLVADKKAMEDYGVIYRRYIPSSIGDNNNALQGKINIANKDTHSKQVEGDIPRQKNDKNDLSGQDEIEKRQSFIYRVNVIAIVLCIVWCFSAHWIAEAWFSYEATKTKEVEEPYQYVVETIDTYECYTTAYGDCYHAASCGSLWNSSYKTTVYEAKRDGYVSCSKCRPRVATTYEVTETRYRTVTKAITEVEVPSVQVAILGILLTSVLWFVIVAPSFAKIQEIKDQLQ